MSVNLYWNLFYISLVETEEDNNSGRLSPFYETLTARSMYDKEKYRNLINNWKAFMTDKTFKEQKWHCEIL